MKEVRLILIGAHGRMGKAIASIAGEGNATIVAPDDRADVLIDFSAAAATLEVCQMARERNIPLVVGTTGQSETQRSEITATAREVPIVFASNFSVGVNALFWLTEQAAKMLDEEFDLEIVEAHHRLKKDAPSGTAKTLIEILQATRSVKNVRSGREGMVGVRDKGEIGVHSLRGGDIVGEHTVIFAGEGERLELIHRATSRETFARGALRAARWLIGKPARLYSMRDVLGL